MEDAVQEYVDRSRSIVDSAPQMDEETTKLRLVQPFIELLGWNPRSPEVEPEYPIQMGTRTFKVDYALLVGDTPVLFIEAKPCRDDISDENIQQLKTYMRQELEVDWGVITNGRRFDILSKAGAGQDGEIKIGSFGIDEIAENPGILRIVSKDAITSGKSDQVAAQIASVHEAIDRLETDESAAVDRIASVLADELGEEVPLDYEAQATDFAENLIATLRERSMAIGGTENTDTTVEKTQTPPLSEFETEDEPESPVGTYTIELVDGEALVAAFGADRQSEVMVATVDHLIQEYDLIERLGPMPYVPSEQKAIINDEPEYEAASHAYKELVNGYYLDTKLARGAKKHEIEQLAEKCGLGVRFGGEW